MRDLNVQTTYQVTTSYFGDSYCSALPASTYTYSLTTTNKTEIWQNWGFEGSGNGWCSQGVFKPDITTTKDLNFNHANYIIVNISPL